MEENKNQIIESLFIEKFFHIEEDFKIKNWELQLKNKINKIQISISKNIESFLNTINCITIDEYLNKKLTFLDFGVPDFYSLYQNNAISIDKISECISHAISYYEPRLDNHKSEIKEYKGKTIIIINASIKFKKESFFEIVYKKVK